jgi:hypothetical protein
MPGEAGFFVPASSSIRARGGELFYKHKLNANFYDRSDGQIWHVPAFYVFRDRSARSMREGS